MEIEIKGKWYPSAGEKVTVRYYMTGTCDPYTVVSTGEGKVYVRECGMDFAGPRYYDSLPTRIWDDVGGKMRELTWSPKRKGWIMSSFPGDKYPGVAEFGVWEYAPYLD